MKKVKYIATIHTIFDKNALAIMRELSHKIERWQHFDKPSDPEQYIARIIRSGSTDNVRIVLIRHNSEVVGSCFIGLITGYDREKTKAEMAYCGSDSSFLDQPSVWLNYVSWEAQPGDSTALPTNALSKCGNAWRMLAAKFFPKHFKSLPVHDTKKFGQKYIHAHHGKLLPSSTFVALSGLRQMDNFSPATMISFGMPAFYVCRSKF